MANRDQQQLEKDARRKASQAKQEKAAAGRVEFNGFVNVTLNDTQRDAWRTWHSQGEEVDDAIQEIVDGVGKLSLSWDTRQGCFICSLFVTGASRPDAGLILTMRGDHWYKALSRTAFVFSLVCNGDLSTRQTARSTGFDDDHF